MTLSALIRKRDTGNPATAIPAIPATQSTEEVTSVARIATVAVANPKDGKNAIPENIGADIVSKSWRWIVHYADGTSTVMACSPEASQTEILKWYPDVVKAELFEPTIRQPSELMNSEVEAAIRAWLEHIGETDPPSIAEVIEQCQRDAEAREYFTGRASSELTRHN